MKDLGVLWFISQEVLQSGQRGKAGEALLFLQMADSVVPGKEQVRLFRNPGYGICPPCQFCCSVAALLDNSLQVEQKLGHALPAGKCLSLCASAFGFSSQCFLSSNLFWKSKCRKRINDTVFPQRALPLFTIYMQNQTE